MKMDGIGLGSFIMAGGETLEFCDQRLGQLSHTAASQINVTNHSPHTLLIRGLDRHFIPPRGSKRREVIIGILRLVELSRDQDVFGMKRPVYIATVCLEI
jgi:hypothetical protein